MATQILAVASGALDSADVVVASGAQLAVALKGAAAPQVSEGQVRVQMKDDAGAYWQVDLMQWNRPAIVLAAGTYRFSRLSNTGSVGVFSG